MTTSGNVTWRGGELDRPATRIDEALGDRSSDLQFVRSVSMDLLGRSPLPDEWKASAGLSRAAFVKQVASGERFWRSWYEETLFYFLLLDNFRPSTDQFASLPQMLAEGRLTLHAAMRALVSSQFFNARNPGNDTFVTVVLEQLLGMTVQKEKRTLEAGKKMYDGASVRFLGERGSNQSDLVRIVVEHEDFEAFLLGRQYEGIFNAPMPEDRKAADAKRLRDDPSALPDILCAWLGSQAYETLLGSARPKADRTFVRCLFVDLLGREANYQEFRRCRNALLALSDSGPLRSVVIKMILDSGMAKIATGGDAEEFVRAQFRKFLCREPNQEELALFAETLASDACTPQTIVRALLTHWEYQHY